MIYYEDFVAEILTESNGAPEIILERMLRNTAIDFLNETELWQERLQFVSAKDVFQIPLTTGFGYSILKLTYCSFDGKELLQVVPHKQFSDKGSPLYYFLRDDILHLRPKTIRADKPIEVEVIYRPNRESEGIPDSIGNKWFECIQHGALARTLMMAGTPWYDPQRAQIYASQYDTAKWEAMREGKRMNHSRIITTRFNW